MNKLKIFIIGCLAALSGLFGPLQAQVTAPITAFQKQSMEVSASNVVGTPLSSIVIVSTVDKDTMGTLAVEGLVIDSVDAFTASIRFSYTQDGRTFTETLSNFRLDHQQTIPITDQTGLSDSIYLIVLYQGITTGDRFVANSSLFGDTDLFQYDPTSRSVVIIDDDQYHVHEREAFWYSDTSGGGASDSLSLGITIPDTNIRYHIVIAAKSNVAATYVLFEDATYTGGTAVTVKNRDRNSSDSSGVLIVKDPNITAHGTTIIREIFGSGNKAGGANHDADEFIAKNNATYVAQIYFDAASAFGGIIVEFYGKIPKTR